MHCTGDLLDYVANSIPVANDAAFVDVLSDENDLGFDRGKIASGALVVYRCKLILR